MQATKSFRSAFKTGKLQTRLIVLILTITVLVFAIVASIVITRAGAQMDQDANKQLQLLNAALTENTSTWLTANARALKQLASLPDIISMDATRQQVVLRVMQRAYPDMYLISTTDLKGINVARSDNEKPLDYNDRAWFQKAKAGQDMVYQSLLGRTSGLPALVASVPIKDGTEQIVGVAMFATELNKITDQVRASTIGQTGFAYIVDAEDRVIAHPNMGSVAELRLRDFSDQAAVIALHQDKKGLFTFTDKDGIRWRAYITKTDSGWGVIVQQQEAEVLNAQYEFQKLALLVFSVGTLLLLVLSLFIIRQSLYPISLLTDTALAIAAGDLNRTAPIKRDDEVGTLARTFNSMTAQLRELINTLEQRVAARTRDLQTAIDVSKQITTVLDINELLQKVVILTAKNFNLYAASIFLTDDHQQKLTLAAGTNAAGQMLTTENIQPVALDAEPSVIAKAARTRQDVMISDVTTSPAYMRVESLPDTRSELAIPMMAGERLLGVFDLQSNVVNGFPEEELRVLRTLAEQIAIAVRNAQLFAEAETARKVAEKADKVKSQFLANMSHELRTPLNAILNFTGFVVDGVLGPLNAEQADALNKTIDSGQHLLSLINDILDLTKIEIGMMDLFIQDVDMNAALKGVLSTAKGLVKDKPINLITEVEENIPSISGDKRRIRQVLLNLVSNAVKFTPQGSVTIKAHHDNGQIHILVCDTGIGIAPEDQYLVFESFRQAKHDLAEVAGTGLGMPISKYFVEAHQGKIWFESEKGVGTTFHVVLPVRSQEISSVATPQV